MTEELKPGGEEQGLVVLPLEEQMNQQLVKANVTDAIIASLRETYLPLKIAGLEDKETYLQVKDGRKRCKALRVEAKKICTTGREEAVAVSKAWIAKEKEVTGQIGEVEDYLEAQEKEYETGIAAEKEARKRKQEEQLIMRQQALTSMGALYADGNFVLGDVSFELSVIKESDEDIWLESIFPKYDEEYRRVDAERLEQERLVQEKEAELKRQQEELEQKQKDLDEKEAELKKEAERQADEARKAREAKELARSEQLLSLGLKFDFVDHYKGYNCFVPMLDLRFHDDEKWSRLIDEVTAQVNRKKEEEAEEKRKEQERIDLQSHRLSELLPYNKYGEGVDIDTLWALTDGSYLVILSQKKDAFEKAQEAERQRIADDAAKKERERIEEEQRQAEIKKKEGLRAFRNAALDQYDAVYNFNVEMGDLGEMSDDNWWKVINSAKELFEETKRKQEEERKAEELLQSSEKVKWQSMMDYLNAMVIHPMRGRLYREKVAILKEKLEEIKAL